MSETLLERDDVTRLWLHRQGLAAPRGAVELSPATLTDHLERTGALQLDSVNVLERAHYLTLWSRFGSYDREAVDRWIYEDRLGYEYWGHEASLLPRSHLPLGLRRMRRFPPASWKNATWWQRFDVAPAAKRRVLKRLREEGALESADFERRSHETEKMDSLAWMMKEDKRALQLLWHAGRVAVRTRRHFRRCYDLAERVYPETEPASLGDYYDSWLFSGLRGCGIASESHLVNYFTGPNLNAAERRRVIARNLRRKRIIRVRVKGLRGPFYARPEDLDMIREAPAAQGTTLVCPFDSLLWQRSRAEDLLDFVYRIEIYVPPAKRRYGYYVLPILHDGRLVGRLDPKLHRDRQRLEIRAIHLEPGFRRGAGFDSALAAALHDLARFAGATRIDTPRGWPV